MKAHWEIRNNILKRLDQDMIQWVEQHPLNSAYIDADAFLENFYFSRSPKTLDVRFLKDDKNIGLEIKCAINNKSTIGQIYFLGDGMWEYHFKAITSKEKMEDVGDMTYHYKGIGYKMNLREKSDESDYIFSLADEINKLLEVPEPYSQNYEPILPLLKGAPRTWSKSVSWAWVEGYHDGPLSGYCYYDRNLYHFSLQEEKEYSGERIFAIYQLSKSEKIRAVIKHWFWEHYTATKLFYKIVNPILKFNKDYFKSNNIIGYFHY